jgi:hypothetical protein
MSSEVTELITALRDGRMTLDQLAATFRERAWPRRDAPVPSTYLEHAAAAEEDPEPYVPNSFDDVVAAYDLGKLSDDEYAVLSAAVAESKRAEDRGRGQETAGSE